MRANPNPPKYKWGKLFLFARMDSTRLPGKQLLPLNGQYNTMSLLVARLKPYFATGDIICASTARECDQPLRAECAQLGIDFFAGDANDTAKRMVQAMQFYGCEFGVRICCDSPLMDGQMVRKAFDEYSNGLDYDIYSNIDFPTHIRPPGQVAEIVSLQAMQRLCNECHDSKILEHCTYYIHLNREKFQYGIFERTAPTSHIKQLALDTADDYEKLQRIIQQLPNPAMASSADIAKVYDRLFG